MTHIRDLGNWGYFLAVLWRGTPGKKKAKELLGAVTDQGFLIPLSGSMRVLLDNPKKERSFLTVVVLSHELWSAECQHSSSSDF